jgi:predicted nucleic acid-binding protein
VTIKAILDTNVIISGIFWMGAPFEILKAWQEHPFSSCDNIAHLHGGKNKIAEAMYNARESGESI